MKWLHIKKKQKQKDSKGKYDPISTKMVHCLMYVHVHTHANVSHVYFCGEKCNRLGHKSFKICILYNHIFYKSFTVRLHSELTFFLM